MPAAPSSDLITELSDAKQAKHCRADLKNCMRWKRSQISVILAFVVLVSLGWTSYLRSQETINQIQGEHLNELNEEKGVSQVKKKEAQYLINEVRDTKKKFQRVSDELDRERKMNVLALAKAKQDALHKAHQEVLDLQEKLQESKTKESKASLAENLSIKLLSKNWKKPTRQKR